MKIFISGGSGTLGSSLCKELASIPYVDQIIVFSRSEDKQILLKNEQLSEKIKYIVGDIRNYESVILASRSCDLIIHTAAIKHIDIAEENPLETVSVNVFGTYNIIQAAKINNVGKVFFVSTDKASLPSGIYGTSKLMGEKLALASSTDTLKVSVFRFGNIIGSSGSIFQRWPEQLQKNNKIKVTSKEMTRFFIEKDDAARYIVSKIKTSNGKEIFIPKMTSKKIFDIAMSFAKKEKNIEIIGARPGEKIHEDILSKHEFGEIFENDEEYIVLPGSSSLLDISSGVYRG
jgi:UDP-N-acetylglucosamine 4,6-dehydratase/5-epimerase